MGDENHENIDQNSKREVKIEAISENKIQIDQKQKIREAEKWGNLHKLRYLIFIAKTKSKTEFKHLQQEREFYKKMSACVENSSYQYCKILHSSLLKKYCSIQGIIDNIISHLWYDEEMFKTENDRIDEILQNYDQNLIKKISKLTKYEIQNNIRIIDVDETIKDQEIKQQTNQILEFIGQFKGVDKSTFKESGITLKKFIYPIEMQIIIEKQNSAKSQFQTIKEKQQMDKIAQNLMSGNEKRTQKRKRKIQNSKQKFLKFKLKDMKKKRMQKKLNSSDNESQQYFIKVDNFKKIKKQVKQRKIVSWTRPENIKIIIFLIIHKEHFDQRRLKYKNEFYLKCSRYINTDKTEKNCQSRIYTLFRQYGKNVDKIINNQVEKLSISEALIEKERKQYNLNFNNKLKFEIDFEDVLIQNPNVIQQPILQQIQQSKLRSIIKIKPIFNYQIKIVQSNPLQNPKLISPGILTDPQHNQLPQDKEQLSEKIQQIRVKLSKPVKSTDRMRVPQKIFLQLMKDFQDQLFIQNSNYYFEIKMQKQLVIHLQFN